MLPGESTSRLVIRGVQSIDQNGGDPGRIGLRE